MTDDLGNHSVWKVNIETGVTSNALSTAMPRTYWRTDSDGVIVARLPRGFRYRCHRGARAPGQTQWSTIAKIRPKDFKSLSDFEFMGPTDKPAQLYVVTKPKDKTDGDNSTLRIYDFVTKTLSAPVWPGLKYDINEIVYESGTYNLSGVCYTVDVETCDFKDKIVEDNIRGIEKAFDSQRNITPISSMRDGRWWLFSVSGPDEPEGYYLYDWQKKTIDLLAERYQNLPSDALAAMSTWSYQTADGAVIHAYLSRPRTAPEGPMPLIVLPHGGPEARDSFAYDQVAQYLATRRIPCVPTEFSRLAWQATALPSPKLDIVIGATAWPTTLLTACAN